MYKLKYDSSRKVGLRTGVESSLYAKKKVGPIRHRREKGIKRKQVKSSQPQRP